jgi:hypothetical protein
MCLRAYGYKLPRVVQAPRRQHHFAGLVPPTRQEMPCRLRLTHSLVENPNISQGIAFKGRSIEAPQLAAPP